MAGSDTAAFSHLFVLVSDIERTITFYSELLGFEVLLREDGYVRIGSADGFHIGVERGEPGQVGGTGIEIQIRVDDVDWTYEKMRAAGVPFRGPPEDKPWGARHAFFTDPDGYPLSIYSPLE